MSARHVAYCMLYLQVPSHYYNVSGCRPTLIYTLLLGLAMTHHLMIKQKSENTALLCLPCAWACYITCRLGQDHNNLQNCSLSFEKYEIGISIWRTMLTSLNNIYKQEYNLTLVFQVDERTKFWSNSTLQLSCNWSIYHDYTSQINFSISKMHFTSLCLEKFSYLISLVLEVQKIINKAVTRNSGHEFCKALQISNSSGALYESYSENNLHSF